MRPKRPTLAPIQKLAKLIENRAEELTDDGKFQRGEKKAFMEKLEPGGELENFQFHAATLTMLPDRIHYIAQLMATGQWRMPMVSMLAKAWGVSYHKVAQWREEAARMLALSMGDREMLKNTAMALLDRIAHDALANGDRRSAVTAVRTFAELGGLIKNQTEISGPDGAPLAIFAAVKNLSDAELDAEIAKSAARRQALRDSVPDAEVLDDVPLFPPAAEEPPAP